MQHLDEGTIHSWLDGALGADEAARAEAHVAECAQCAAAVAEARGFIAASSRILTALDHVPRGVVPAAQPIKWYNRSAWRAAAAVLVVAVGSLVVVRNSGNNASQSSFELRETPDTAPIPKPEPPIIITAAPAETPVRKPQAVPSITPSIRSDASSGVASSGQSAAQSNFSDKAVRGAAPPNVATSERTRDEAVDAAIGGNAAAAPQVAGAVTATAQPALSSRVAGATMLRAVAGEELPLKVVGTPRMIGAKVTLYEVTPGDTVTFIEASNVQLDAVVVTGIATGEPQARRSAGKSAATAPTQVASPSPAALPSRVDVTNGVTTITWPDASTGNMLSLSGRMSADRLKEIKLRIERERAAAAAKKKP
jgi:hypothetical protein